MSDLTITGNLTADPESGSCLGAARRDIPGSQLPPIPRQPER